MSEKEIQEILTCQREFFLTGKTRDINFRLETLKNLKTAIIANEQSIIGALQDDLRKPLMESYTAEIGMVINEINVAIKNLKRWAKPVKVKSTFMVFPAKSYIIAEPLGIALIISPWNYPIQLTLGPLVGAIAAGNCCVIKPSEYANASASIMNKIVRDTFDSRYVAVVEGDIEVSQYLLEQRFDKIFFTGSPNVGKIVMENAAKYLTSVTLELGGKSPCIVDKGVNMEVTAKRILWGKFINAGQTCIAPDYLIVHKEIKSMLYDALSKGLKTFFTEKPEDSPDLGRIINKKHFNRIKNYLQDGKIIVGGCYDEDRLYIAPTILEVNDLNVPVMQEEIFGPILPVIEYSSLEEIESIIARNPNPLGFYVFSLDKETIQRLIHRISFGGGCINDTLSHTMNNHLPFGGRGESGMGSYHGIHSFDAFSHKKSILEKEFAFDMTMKYPPYKDGHTFVRKYLLK